MRMFIMVIAFSLSSCATRATCPPLPQMGDQETLKDYTVKVIDMYNECAK